MPTQVISRPRKGKLSRLRKPEHLTLHDWQIGLRRQFADDQRFTVRNLGREPVFSEFAVTNPKTERTYRVAVRGDGPGLNYCSCPDYAVNTLGTCKHVEYLLKKLRRQHARALSQGYQPPFAEVYVRYAAQRCVMFSPGAGLPPALSRLAQRYFDADGVLRASAFASFDAFMRGATATGHDVRVYEDALRLITEVRDAQARQSKLDDAYDAKIAAPWNRLLKVDLYPYQREGALFAARAGRAVIADDMGLGKTIQAIAAAEILARECQIERVLIVCPSSVKYQWLREIGQFSARPAAVIEGSLHLRKEQYGQAGFFKIVNYDVLHRDVPAINAWEPDLIVLDEAQRIKNWQTRAARTVKQLDSRYAIVLTGTPLENRIEELHSIVEFIDRHRLGPLFAFKAAHEVHEKESNSPRVIGYRDLDTITKTLSPILIRRTKAEVLKQLPPRMDKNFFVPMTKEQWAPHDENKEIVARIVAKWHRWGFLSEADQLRLRIALQYMRMSCDNTYLVDHKTRHGAKVDELARLLDEVFEDRSAKAVIFSQWTRMNELVAEMLEDRKWGHVELHGGVPSKERGELTRALREDPDCRVFLSTDAGGVGLNLQTASTVINMDLPWNPAVLEQRIGRVHRLGQKQPVRVVNFISEHAIEHGMLSLLKFKRSVFSGVLDGAAKEVFLGESALKRFMKTVERATADTPPPVEGDHEDAAEADVLTDEEGDAPVSQPESPGAQPHIARPSSPKSVGFDADALGALLSQGAALLQTLGRSLSQPPDSRSAGNGQRSGARIEIDPSSGRRELRVALPDGPVIHQLLQHFSSFLGGMSG